MTEKLSLLTAMLIFGTIGLFVREVHLPSELIAFLRAVMGTLLLFGVAVYLRRRPLAYEQIRSNLKYLLISGIFIGFNWIFLFEAYHYTTISIATLCYYTAPVFVTIASPLVEHTRLTSVKIACAVSALAGMVCISGIFQGVPDGDTLSSGNAPFIGIAFGLAAAVLYACIILLNKKIVNISSYESVLVQLAAAAAVLLPYTICTVDFSSLSVTMRAAGCLLVLGTVHTGLAYALYFYSISHLPVQTVAMLGYLDPITAIILSALVLGEPFGFLGAVGTVLILGATLIGEIYNRKTSCNR